MRKLESCAADPFLTPTVEVCGYPLYGKFLQQWPCNYTKVVQIFIFFSARVSFACRISVPPIAIWPPEPLDCHGDRALCEMDRSHLLWIRR